MAWRFRRSVKILPGVRMNLGKKGVSWSFGGRGLTYTVGKNGTRTTVGIPGTGLSHTTYQKHNTQTPSVSAQQAKTHMGRPKRSGKLFFILGGSAFGLALLGSIINSRSIDRPKPATPSPVVMATPDVPPPVARPVATATIAPVVEARPIATPVLQASATPVMQQQVLRAEPVIKEPNPPSDNYIPPRVRLTSAISIPIFEKGKQVGLSSIPVGTQVELNKINGVTVDVTYQGNKKTISASSTDLLARMLGTADD